MLSDDEFQLLFGLSRLVPGMNLLSLTVLLGYRFHGLTGAVLCLCGPYRSQLLSYSVGLPGAARDHMAGPVMGRADARFVGRCSGAAGRDDWSLSRGSLVKLAPRAQVVWRC